MAQYHQLDSSNKLNIKYNDKNIERVKEYKLLGIIYFMNTLSYTPTLIKFWKMVIPLYEHSNY